MKHDDYLRLLKQYFQSGQSWLWQPKMKLSSFCFVPMEATSLVVFDYIEIGNDIGERGGISTLYENTFS